MYRRHVRRAAGLTTALAAVCAMATAPAHAAPGVPAPPVPVFAEDFENVDDPLTGELLTDYVGASGTTYTAAPQWVSAAFCNGFVISVAGNPFPGCSQAALLDNIVSRFALLGLDENNNHALAAATAGNPGADLVQFETATPIGLSASNRFITFSVDSAAVNCFANGTGHPLYKFFLTGAGPDIPAFNAPINGCTDPRGTTFPGGNGGGMVGSFASDKAVLFSGSEIGLKMINGQGNGQGNDAAIDNVVILDATPSLDKAFSPSTINQTGQTGTTVSTLTFVVTNTTDLGEKAGWSFTDQLPAGVTVAGAGASDCANATVGAVVNSNVVSVSGDLATGQSSCTVTVPVQAGAPGSYLNGPDNIGTVGLNEPAEPVELKVNTPPTVQIDGPQDGGEYFVGQPLTAEFSCADSDGTVDSCTGTTGNGDPIPTGTPGVYQLTVTAVDDNGATTTRTITFRVRPVGGLCRGTPLFVLGIDPATANRPESPCVTQQKSIVRLNSTIGSTTTTGLLGVVLKVVNNLLVADAIEGSTTAGLASARGEAHVADATLTALGLVIRVQGVHSEAISRLTNGCGASEVRGESSIAGLTINGIKQVNLNGPVSIPLPGLGGIYLNQQVRQGSTITQRAVFIDLPGTNLDVAIGESKAGVACT